MIVQFTVEVDTKDAEEAKRVAESCVTSRCSCVKIEVLEVPQDSTPQWSQAHVVDTMDMTALREIQRALRVLSHGLRGMVRRLDP
jgi:hypothetical protein